MQDVFIELS